MAEDEVEGAVRRMRAWADAHGEADTQGLMPGEWEGLARAALGLPTDLGQHFATCEKDDCPWKFRGASREATDTAATFHVREAGHDVIRTEPGERWRMM